MSRKQKREQAEIVEKQNQIDRVCICCDKPFAVSKTVIELERLKTFIKQEMCDECAEGNY